MNVKDLIDYLKRFPPEAKVIMPGRDVGFSEVCGAEEQNACKVDRGDIGLWTDDYYETTLACCTLSYAKGLSTVNVPRILKAGVITVCSSNGHTFIRGTDGNYYCRNCEIQRPNRVETKTLRDGREVTRRYFQWPEDKCKMMD